MTTMTTMQAIMRRGLGLGTVAFTVLLAFGTLGAQVPAPPQERPIALTGATLHTITHGVIPNGTIVFEDGVITALGADIQIPVGAERWTSLAGTSTRASSMLSAPWASRKSGASPRPST
jgi:hypothetical protein